MIHNEIHICNIFLCIIEKSYIKICIFAARDFHESIKMVVTDIWFLIFFEVPWMINKLWLIYVNYYTIFVCWFNNICLLQHLCKDRHISLPLPQNETPVDFQFPRCPPIVLSRPPIGRRTYLHTDEGYIPPLQLIHATARSTCHLSSAATPRATAAAVRMRPTARRMCRAGCRAGGVEIGRASCRERVCQ